MEPTQDQEKYIFDKPSLILLMEEHFNLSKNTDRWGKDRLASINLLSQVFNSYIDVAQETLNFTDFKSLSSSDETKFKKTIAKNLLFIFNVLQEKQITPDEALQALSEPQSNV